MHGDVQGGRDEARNGIIGACAVSSLGPSPKPTGSDIRKAVRTG